jgi:hypothetical protein
MNDLANTIHSMPWASMIPIALLVFVGLLLWVAGKRVLKPGFVIIGFGFGGLLGWVLGDSIKMGVEPWGAMIIGAFVVAVIAVFSYRVTVIAATAAICGVLSPLGVLTMAQSGTANADTVPDKLASATPSGLMSGLKEIIKEQQKIEGDTPEAVRYWRSTLKDHDRLSANADLHIEQATTLAQQTAAVAREAWDRTPQGLRPTLVASAVIGTIAGLLLGIVAPMLGAAAVTSLGGSMLWLSGGRVLATGFGAPDQWWPSTGTGWLTMWLITATIGLGIQWAFRKRLADKTG